MEYKSPKKEKNMKIDAKKEGKKINLVNPKNLEISYFVGPGNGGQNKQKTSSGVHIFHPDSGGIGRCSDSRSQAENKVMAFRRLCESTKMKSWLRKKQYEIAHEMTMEAMVEQQMRPEHLEIQVRKDGKWIVADDQEALTKLAETEEEFR